MTNQRNVSLSLLQSGWDVTKPGVAQVLFHDLSQADARAWAYADLKREGGGELIVHGLDGKIREKTTVPQGNDPFPPRG